MLTDEFEKFLLVEGHVFKSSGSTYYVGHVHEQIVVHEVCFSYEVGKSVFLDKCIEHEKAVESLLDILIEGASTSIDTGSSNMHVAISDDIVVSTGISEGQAFIMAAHDEDTIDTVYFPFNTVSINAVNRLLTIIRE